MSDLKADETGIAIVPVLACVLQQLCLRNDRLPMSNKGMSKFHALRPPAISIKDYLQRVAKYAACSGECFVLALVYIDRIIQTNSSFVVNSLNIHRLLITSIMLAAKFFDDQYFNNAYYAKVGGVPCAEMNSLEVEFLFLCNFFLFVNTDTYSQYYTELCNHALNINNLCSCSQGPRVPLLAIPGYSHLSLPPASLEGHVLYPYPSAISTSNSNDNNPESEEDLELREAQLHHIQNLHHPLSPPQQIHHLQQIQQQQQQQQQQSVYHHSHHEGDERDFNSSVPSTNYSSSGNLMAYYDDHSASLAPSAQHQRLYQPMMSVPEYAMASYAPGHAAHVLPVHVPVVSHPHHTHAISTYYENSIHGQPGLPYAIHSQHAHNMTFSSHHHAHSQFSLIQTGNTPRSTDKVHNHGHNRSGSGEVTSSSPTQEVMYA